MDKEKLSVPENMNLPFFAYGFFKPHELAYNQIKEYCDGSAEEAYVYGLFYEKDGVPILKTDDIENKGRVVMGAVIKFYRWKKEKAYKVISDMEPSNLYRWKEVIASHDRKSMLVNILVYAGDDTADGTIPGAECIDERVSYWVCRDDPLMGAGMNYLRETYFQPLAEYHRGTRKSVPMFSQGFWGKIFQMQMAYVFFWTILDRYKSLKYGLGIGISRGNGKLAKDKHWQDAVQQIEGILQTDSLDLITKGINSLKNNLEDTLIDRFYSIRCNAVHRGKAVNDDKAILTQAFMLLYPIVSYIITCDVHHEEGNAKKQLEEDCLTIRSVFRLER